MNTALSSSDIDYISLDEAVKATGVSEATLRRFADAGYCKTTVTNGEIAFQKDELYSLFKIAYKPSIARPTVVSRPTQPVNVTEVDIEEEQAELIATTTTPQPAAIEQTVATPAAAQETSQAYETLHAEVIKLQALSELHEKYISFKESEIKSLTEERDWLRTRIEKLEDKAERDQVIMVSLSETQRGLLTQLDKKRSTLQLALEWVGIIPPASSNK